MQYIISSQCNAEKLHEDVDFAEKESSFGLKLIFILVAELERCRIWGSDNTLVLLQKPMHLLQVTVCSGL